MHGYDRGSRRGNIHGIGSIRTNPQETTGRASYMIDGMRLQMLGPLTISRNGAIQALPASRKVRALIGYLALAKRPVRRSELCGLLWDVPNDPRGELRWSLSKLRRIFDEPGRRRVVAAGEAVGLDLAGCFVDVVDIANVADAGTERLDPQRLRTLSTLFIGDFLEGLEIERCPLFSGWLVAQRRRFHACHIAVLERLASKLPPNSDEALAILEAWLHVDPLDQRPHALLLAALAMRGRFGDGEEHLAAAGKLFEAEGLEWTSLRSEWRLAKERCATSVAPAWSTIVLSAPASATCAPDAIAKTRHRASIAVMPFLDLTEGTSDPGGPADGLTHDVITRLAKLRSLFVIARGSVFALRERGLGPMEAGQALDTDYFAGGWVRRRNGRVTAAVEVAETRTARIVWAETFDYKLDDTFLVLDEIGNRIVTSIANEIEAAERNRAMLKPPDSLDAWEAYHRGLWHMYRFTRQENQKAQAFFQMAVRLDPTFARAYASLSFTHWQNAFQNWADRAQETDCALAAAGQALVVEERDPSAHWAMGRALWLRGSQDDSLRALERAVDLSPNFALGHYALGFVHCQSGDPETAIRTCNHSRHLSPFDPLLFGMLAARALAHVRLGQFEEGADWAVKAAARPNAHAHILAIAAECLGLAGRLDEARAFAASIRRAVPHYRVEDYLAAFRFAPDAAELFRQGAARIGLG